MDLANFSGLYSNLEERANSSDNSGDNSPSTPNFTSISSSKRSKRTIQKKVVMIPIKDLEGTKFKSDCTPPLDSWAWRKYGQKPIKGSPYPRGYYRCSSSKGCPARKQAERSHSDPSMLVVTYSYEHNHTWPTSRNHHHNRTTSTTPATLAKNLSTQLITPPANNKSNLKANSPPVQFQHNTDVQSYGPDLVEINNQPIQFQSNNSNNTNMDTLHQPLIPPMDELTWLSTDHEILQNDYMFNSNNNFNFNDLDMAKLFPMRDDDDSFFADLGELPECPVVFSRAATGEEKHQTPQCNLTPWCGSTG